MSHPQSQRQPNATETDRYANALRITALAGLVVCPAIALLPPRKLDFYTVGLITATGWSANVLIRDRTGRSIYQHITPARAREPIAHQHSSVSQTEQSNLHRELNSASSELQRMGKPTGAVTEEIMSQGRRGRCRGRRRSKMIWKRERGLVT